jgi:hypothetical protein
MLELLVRFVIGGFAVSMFALLADVIKPKSFAGLFGGAPSVALVTLSLTILKNGEGYAATEARSMTIGAVAFLVYACCVGRVLLRGKVSATVVAISGLAIWLGCAFGLWYVVLR